MLIRLHVAALLLLPLVSPARAAIVLEPELAPRIDAVLAEYAKPGSPGCALALYERGRVLHAKGYGLASIEHGVAIDPLRTVFDIGSTSKQFTAASILLLAQEGKLSLDDSVRQYVPELPGYFDQVTLDHLLRHTGGVRDYIGLLMLGGINVQDHTTDADALHAIARQKALDFAPGSEFSYSNSGYFLLSLVVKKASGKSLREFAQERFFTPLGMQQTRILDDHTLVVPNRATSYEPGTEGIWVLSTSAWEQNGDGAVQTTAMDLALWDANFYEPKVGGSALMEQLQQVGKLNDGEAITYARGLIVEDYRGLRSVSHGGSWMGFRSELLRFPDSGMAVAALCNVGSSDPSSLARAVADVVLAGQLEPAAKPAAAPADANPRPEATAQAAMFDPGRYTGIYYSPAEALVRPIELRDGKLWYVRQRGQDSELAYEGADRFNMLDVPSPASLQFGTAENGQKRMTFEMGTQRIEMRQVARFEPDAQLLATFAGQYESVELDTRWTLAMDDGKLVVQPRRGAPVPLSPAFGDAFTGMGLLRFQRTAGGEITGFAVDVGRARGISFSRVGATTAD
ncbi:MAG: beta-lactamase family protein [Arenimonas sp.]|uniref:serine hydrolase domain-containing protein n=1 Tax=Arenimonas sp. TaxID=1872635 RepID=UPI0025C6613C|nr:serine hydrolase domain-containing protein [Arenimonas sp.]MBW8367482.1 beta-lactamase family protein [Arenimonas sp.]